MAIKPSSTTKGAPSALLTSLIEAYLAQHGLEATSKALTKELKSHKRVLSHSDADTLKNNSLESILYAWQITDTTSAASSKPQQPTATNPQQSNLTSSTRQVAESNDDSDSDSSSSSSSSSAASSSPKPKLPSKLRKPKTFSSAASSSSSSSASSSSSSDSDADDEQDAPVIIARMGIKKPAVKAHVPSIPAPAPAQKSLKRKAAELSSDSSSSASTSDSDSDSDSSSEESQSESDEEPPAKRTKHADTNINGATVKPNPILPASELESDPSSETDSTSSSDSDSDASMVDVQQVAAAVPAPASDSSDESDSDASSEEEKPVKEKSIKKEKPIKQEEPIKREKVVKNEKHIRKEKDGDDTIMVKETVIFNKEPFTLKDDDSAVASSSSGTIVGTIKPTLTTPEVKKRHQGARPTPLAALSANTTHDSHISNSYQSYEYADKAYNDLSVTRGKGFTKEKNKKKRGSYRGGAIDTSGGKGFKFED